MSRVVCLGAALQDIFLASQGDIPLRNKIQSGEKTEVDQATYCVGGGGINTAVSLARHDHETILMSSIAHDVCGATVLELLDQENIDSSYMQIIDEGQTGCSIILVDQDDDSAILTYYGTATQYNDLDEHDLELIHPDWLYITTLGGDFDTLNRFCDKARELNCKVMFNPGNLELANTKALIAFLSKVDILLVNKEEASQIVSGQLPEELLEQLQRHVETVIITADVMGGIASDGNEIWRFGLYEHTKVIDTTGAGDAFGAGFLAHYLSGHSFSDSLIFASANSTSVIGDLGATTGVLSSHTELHPMPIQQL